MLNLWILYIQLENGLEMMTFKDMLISFLTLEELLNQRWEDRGGQPIHIVVNEPTNSLMIRIPRHLWPEAQKILEELDQQENF